MPIDVSVIIAVTGRDDFVAEAARSALEQDGPNVEVLLPADASAGPDRLAGLPEDERLVVRRHPGQLGTAALRNRGVATARGRWLAFLAPCDAWAPDHLASFVDLAEEEGAHFAFSAGWIIDAARRITGFQSPPPARALPTALLGGELLVSPSAIIGRRMLWQREAGFDEWLHELAAWDLAIRWSRSAPAAVGARPTVALARPQVRSDEELRRLCREFRELERRYEGDAEAAGLRFGGSRFRLALARGQASQGHRRRAAAWTLRSGLSLRGRAARLPDAARVLLGRPVPVPDAPAEAGAPPWLQDRAVDDVA
jgi:teichuronic acid biosynthesis glycosyltransferase TuaG